MDAGVLIHESILEFDQSLCVEAELWDIWLEFAKENLPLPLGGMALRRSLPLSDAIKIERDLTNAVKIADANRKILAPMLIERKLIRVNEEKLDTYLNLYANKNSISMNQTQLLAVDTLFKLGYDYKFYDKIIHVNDYLIPSEYEEARNLKRIKMDESTLVALGVQTFKITLLLSLPMLLAGLIAGLVISIFQATTQINEMTLSFVPKIILVVVILIFLMPWMTTTMIDFTENILNQIPTFIK